MIDLASIALHLIDDLLVRREILAPPDGRSLHSYAKELGTIKLGSCRQNGHTTAAAQVAVHFENPLIVVPRAAYLTRLTKTHTFPKKATLSCVRSLTESTRGARHDIVIADMCSLFSEKDFEKLYDPSVLECFCEKKPLYLLLQ